MQLAHTFRRSAYALGEKSDGSELDCDLVSLTRASDSLRHVESVLHPQMRCLQPEGGGGRPKLGSSQPQLEGLGESVGMHNHNTRAHAQGWESITRPRGATSMRVSP